MTRLAALLLICSLCMCGCSDKKEKPAQQPQEQNPVVKSNDASSDASELWASGVNKFREGVKLNDTTMQFEGMDLLEQAVLKDPDNRAAWVDLADAYIYSNNRLLAADAIGICENLYADEKKQPDLLLERICKAYAIIGNDAAAQAIARKWVQTAPPERLAPAVQLLTLLAGQTDDIKPAIETLEERAKTVKSPGFIYLMLASLYELDGQKSKAVSSLKAAIKVLPGDSQQTNMAKSELRRLES